MSDTKPSLLTPIEDTKLRLHETLAAPQPDDILVNGMLNFARGRFLQLILKDINTTVGVRPPSNNELQLAQNPVETPVDQTAEVLIDRIWSDFYHPVFKYYAAVHQGLAQSSSHHRNKKPVVELRKINAKFLKTAKLSRDFFFDLLKHILTQFNLGPMIPDSFYSFLGLTLDTSAHQIPLKNQIAIVKIVYICHRSMLFIGATSRYRSSLSLLLSEKSQEDFHQALDMCYQAELLLPAFGEARNQIGMVYNTHDNQMLAAYEFLRSSSARIPSPLGSKNFQAILRNTQPIVNNLNRLRIENKPTQRTRIDYISNYFLPLYGYHLAPSSWMRTEGIIINGTKIEELETDWLKIVRQLALDGDDSFLLEKMMLMLIAGVVMLDTRGSGASASSVSDECKAMLRFTLAYIVHLEDVFIELWDTKHHANALKLLPFLRVVFSWLKNSRAGVYYAHRNYAFLVSSSKVVNLILSKHDDDSKFKKRPVREQYFKEDVGVKEFAPIERMLYDFNDEHIFHAEESQARLIGTYIPHETEEENNLRMVAVGYLAKKILLSRPNGVTYDSESKLMKLDDDIMNKYKKFKEKLELAKKLSKASTPTSLDKKPQRQEKGSQEPKRERLVDDKKKQKIKRPISRSDTPSKLPQFTNTTPFHAPAIREPANPPPKASALFSDSLPAKNDFPPLTMGDDSSDGDVEEISESEFEALKITERKKINILRHHDESIEEIDTHVISSQTQYTDMVNSLVADPLGSLNAPAVTANTSSNWNASPHQQVQFSNTNGYAAYNGAFSPNPQSGSVFPPYQNYYPSYQSPQQQQQQQQQQPVSNVQTPNHGSYQQFAGVYATTSQYQTPQGYPQYQQYSPYGMYGQQQQPVMQVPETPSQPIPQQGGQQSNSHYPPENYYPYGSGI